MIILGCEMGVPPFKETPIQWDAMIPQEGMVNAFGLTYAVPTYVLDHSESETRRSLRGTKWVENRFTSWKC